MSSVSAIMSEVELDLNSEIAAASCGTCAGHGVEGADSTLRLRVAGTNISSDVMARYPHLYGCTMLELPEDALVKVSWHASQEPGLCKCTCHVMSAWGLDDTRQAVRSLPAVLESYASGHVALHCTAIMVVPAILRLV